MSIILALISSIDSFFIGLSLKATNTKLTKRDFIEMFTYSFLLLFVFHFICKILSISIINPYMKSVLFFLLGIYSLKIEQEKPQKKKITTIEKLFLVIGNSIDGLLVSLTLFMYSSLYLSLLFSSITVLLLIIGYHLPMKEKDKPYSLSSLAYFLIAFFSLF